MPDPAPHVSAAPAVGALVPGAAPGPFRLARGWLVALFLGVGLLSCFDFQFAPLAWLFPKFYLDELQRHLGILAALILLVADRERAPALLRRRAWLGLGIVLATCVWIYLMHDLADRSKRREMLDLLLGTPGFWMWAAGVWLATPLLLPARAGDSSDAGAGNRAGPDFAAAAAVPPALRWGIAALLLVFTLELVAAAASLQPKRSIPAFFAHRAALLPLLVGWVRTAWADAALARATGRGFAWLLALLMLGGGIVLALDRLGGDAVRDALTARKLVYTETPGISDPTMPPRRLNFPLLNFNRMAHLALIAMAVLLAAQCAAHSPFRRARWERWPALLAPLAFGLAAATYTRGILLGMLAGCVAAAALVSRRMALATLLAVCAGLALFPSRGADYLRTAFRPETYAPAPGQDMTSMQMRIAAWNWAAEEIAESPLTGIGFGTRLVRDEYMRHVREHGTHRQQLDLDNDAELQHMHNVWIETALESGLPAAVALAGFTLLRWGALLGALRGARGARRARLACWAGLELALAISGLVFYMLKQNLGFLQWMLWLWILLEATRPRPVPSESAELGPSTSSPQTTASPAA